MPIPVQVPMPAKSVWLIPILGALVAFGPLSIDMYLSALPAIAREFGSTSGAAQYTLAAYFVGMALGQCFYGPLSDSYGRKLPLYFGLTLYVAASLGCALAPSLASLLACRFLQALGGCSGIVIPLAIVRDLYQPQDTARILSRLMLIMGVAPMLAPMAGAQLEAEFGWRAIFWVLAAFGMAGLAAVHGGLAESLDPRHVRRTSVMAALRTYGRLLMDRQFLGFALPGGLTSAAMFAYIAASPTVLIQLYGVSPQTFSWLFGMNAFGLIAASQINHRLLAFRHVDHVLASALSVLAVLGLALLLAAYFAAPGWMGVLALPALLIPLFGYVAVLGFIAPNASAGAMAGHAAQAGSASALLGTMRFGLATMTGAAVGFFNDGSAHAMGIVMAFCGVAAWLLHRILIKTR